LKIPFQQSITCPQIFKITVAKPKKKNLQSFSDYRSRWSKEPQWKKDCGSFLQLFYTVTNDEMWTSIHESPNLKLIITLPEQHYNNLSHTSQLSPYVGPMPMEALMFGLGWVWPAMPLHPYKPLGLLAGALPHCQETCCLSTKSWGQVDNFPAPLGLVAP
jgi:hypothetical protein